MVDLPGTLEIGARDLRAAGVTPVAGDATQGLPEGPWDAVHLGNIAHLLDRDEAAALVARAVAALRARRAAPDRRGAGRPPAAGARCSA